MENSIPIREGTTYPRPFWRNCWSHTAKVFDIEKIFIWHLSVKRDVIIRNLLSFSSASAFPCCSPHAWVCFHLVTTAKFLGDELKYCHNKINQLTNHIRFPRCDVSWEEWRLEKMFPPDNARLNLTIPLGDPRRAWSTRALKCWGGVCSNLTVP